MDSEGLAFKFLSERVYLFMLLLCMLCWKHYLVQKNGKVKEVQPVIFILQRKINFPQLFLHEEMFLYFWREICEQILFNFFVEKVARGNSVQIAPNFPAKSLSICTSGFFQTPFKLIKILDVKNNCCLSTCFIWDIKQIIKKYSTVFYWWNITSNET